MKDVNFFNVTPSIPKKCEISKRKQLCLGYRPDLVIKEDGLVKYIIENENNSSRKHILGGVLNSYKFTLVNKCYIILIFVLNEHKKLNKTALSNYLTPYVNWLDGAFRNNNYLKNIFIINDLEYLKNINNKIPINSNNFFQNCILIKRGEK